ncbi:MAG: cupin domain-containing protein [Labilithrix sp.]|nr:cupin domain-containing protein [Labilithrix sp.]MCW5817715.1 cupin domain-containing protein [Labilithrix sp.]
MLGGLSPARFLREYWQKKPLLVRQAFPAFADPLTPEELAGLACEDGVESRIVRGKGRRWDVAWGPHPESRFIELPDREWTLLVQEVNRWVPDAALLLDAFSWIPNVRVDDVMVSYAERGGSVGPHLDSYDVFLVQGRGERRWQWGSKPAEDRTFVPGLVLRILADPVLDRDEVLRPGDMLYLPPGFAHHGIAESPCLTYSIGFRAPSAAEAWTSFAAAAASRPGAAELLADPPLAPAREPGAIPPALLARARAMIRSLDLSDDAIDRWFAAHTTRLKPGHTLEAPRTAPDAKKILARLAKKNATLVRSEEGRWAFLPAARGALRLYVAGEEIAVPREASALAKLLCRARRHDGASVLAAAKNAAARALLERLFAIGALSFGAIRR